MLFSRTALPQRRVWLAVELPLLFGRDCAPQRNAVEGTAESQNGQASERFLIRRQDRVHGLDGIFGEPPSRGDIFQGEEERLRIGRFHALLRGLVVYSQFLSMTSDGWVDRYQ